MMFRTIWPEHRFLTAAQIRGYFTDAVANGDIIIAEANTSKYSNVTEMIGALTNAGLFTFAEPYDGLEETI